MAARLLKLALSKRRFAQQAVEIAKQFGFLVIKALMMAIAILLFRTPSRF